MKNYYFTFGQGHVHKWGTMTLDKDIVAVVRADSVESALRFMVGRFGQKWANMYTEDTIDMSYFPRGLFHIGIAGGE